MNIFWIFCVVLIIQVIWSSLGSKETLFYINNAFKNFSITWSHSGMCKKSKKIIESIKNS